MNATWSQIHEYLWAIDFKEGLVNYFVRNALKKREKRKQIVTGK